jgi:hypothetical protein
VTGTEPLASASDTGVAMTAAEPTSDVGNAYQPTHEEIARAAYFRHLNRGGGSPFEDWLEAERELRQRRR